MLTMRDMAVSGLLDELARGLGVGGSADVVLATLGFPPGQLPVIQNDPIAFWHQICRRIEDGAIVGDQRFERLLGCAAMRLPGNSRLAPFQQYAAVWQFGRGGDPEPKPRSIVPSSVRSQERFDVFLSYSSSDEEEVTRLAEELKSRGVEPWFDRWYMPPGTSVIKELAQVLRDMPAIAICAGRSAVGPWQAWEMEAAIHSFVKKKRKIVPVLLPSAPPEVEWPFFLEMFSHVRIDGSFRGRGFEDFVRAIKSKSL